MASRKQYHAYRYEQTADGWSYIVRLGHEIVAQVGGFATKGKAMSALSSAAFRNHWTLRYDD